MATLQPPDGTDLFPPSIYGWLPVNENEPNCDIRAALDAAVTQGAGDWYGATLFKRNKFIIESMAVVIVHISCVQ